MDELLEDIYMSSSYIEGVYVIGNDGDLLFYVGDDSGSIPDVSQLEQNGDLYGSIEYGDVVYIYLDIANQNDLSQGKLLMKLDGAALENIINKEKEEAFRQSVIIALEICALGAVVIIASKMQPGKKRLRSFC